LVLQSPIVIRDANLRHDNTAETLKIITHSRGSILFMKCRWRRDGGPMLWFCKYFWPKLVFKIFAILNPSTTTFGYEKWSQDCCSKQRPFCFTKKIGKMPPPQFVATRSPTTTRELRVAGSMPSLLLVWYGKLQDTMYYI
jgi:hypothetical protein